MSTASEAQSFAQPRIAAGALFTDIEGRILLVRPTYKGYWDIPGGYVESGESPRAACARELHEELGLTPDIGALLVVDWAPLEGEGDKILFVFDGGTLTDHQAAQLTLDHSELSEWRYVARVDLDQYVPARLTRRLLVATIAKNEGKTAYAEHGHPIER